MSTANPVITEYLLPHPYDLIREGKLELRDKNGTPWIPTESDDAYLLSRLRAQSPSELEEMSLECELKYTDVSYWADDLVANFEFPYGFQGGIPGTICLHFSVAEGSMKFVGRVDNGQPEASKVFRDSKRNESRLLDDDAWSSTFDQFSDGHLYSIAYVTPAKESNVVEPIVLVHNIHSRSVTWFRPEVPESEYVDQDAL
jgi:hypothetical protein